MITQKRISEFGAAVALNRTLPFSEKEALEIILPYLKRNLGFVEGEVVLADDVKGKEGPGYIPAIIETAEPGSPAFIFWNV